MHAKNHKSFKHPTLICEAWRCRQGLKLNASDTSEITTMPAISKLTLEHILFLVTRATLPRWGHVCFLHPGKQGEQFVEWGSGI